MLHPLLAQYVTTLALGLDPFDLTPARQDRYGRPPRRR